MILEAKMKKKYYKSTDEWLDAVYENNKQIINKNVLTEKIEKEIENRIDDITDEEISEQKKAAFKNLVKERKDEGMGWVAALKSLSKSTIFTPEKERLISNAYKALKKDREAYKTFRELSKEKGRYTKVDFSKFRYDRETHTYIYNDLIRISFSSSPKEVKVDLI